jgi:hypothetical protein
MTPPAAVGSGNATGSDAFSRRCEKGSEPISCELETILVRQIDSARAGDMMTVLELGRQFDAILARNDEALAAAASSARVRQLHAELRLIVAQQTAEVGARRERLGRGRATLRAYGATRPRGR